MTLKTRAHVPAWLAMLASVAITSEVGAHDHTSWDNGCCEQDLEHCNARPDHPDPACQAGHIGLDLSDDCPFDLSGCIGLPAGCTADIPTGSVQEVANGIDDDCDYYVDDEQCDNFDNDGDGMVDEDPGSCLVKVAFVPLCWDDDDAEFELAVAEQWFMFLDKANLSCPDNVSKVVVLPSATNLPCPTCSNGCGVDEVAAAIDDALPDLRALDFDAIFALTDQEICGDTEGCSNRVDTIWGERDDQHILFAHEFGHILGLHDEYCSVDAGAQCGNCNRGAGPSAPPNFLGTDLGCDPQEDGCCDGCSAITSCDLIEVCCEGNESGAGDGRCIMSYADAEDPRAYCARCAAYLASPTDPRSASNPEGQAPMDCAFSHVGHQPVASLRYSVDEENHLEILHHELGLGRLGLGGVPTSGTHEIALYDSQDTLLHQSSLTPVFGYTDPRRIGVDYSAIHYPRHIQGLRALVPAALGPLEPLRIVLSEGGAPVFQSTVNGSPPVADAGPDFQAECTSSTLTPVLLDGSGSFDPDGDSLTYEWSSAEMVSLTFDDPTRVDPTVLVPLGTSSIQLVVRDGVSPSSPDTVDVTVADTTPPEVVLTATPSVLAPPNHEMTDIVVSATILDTCDPSPTLVLSSVTSSDPDNGEGDGNTINDIQGAQIGALDLALRLRSERGQGGPRTYTITYTASDAAGNSADYSVLVVVP